MSQKIIAYYPGNKIQKRRNNKMKNLIVKKRVYEYISILAIFLLPVYLFINWVLEGYGSNLYTIITLLSILTVEMFCYIRLQNIKKRLKSIKRRLTR